MYYYLVIISIFVSFLTVIDKLAAKKFPRHRIPEKVLMFIGFIGGASAEFLTMLIIRHKTKHKKFMVGLPIMIIFHVCLALIYTFYK